MKNIYFKGPQLGLIWFFLTILLAAGQTSSLVYPGPDGKLIYQGYANEGQSSTGNKMIDFSSAGYKGGGVAIPMVPAVITLSPNPSISDDHARIQAAIDTVSTLPLSSAGFRGAILLKSGEYRVSETLNVSASGVVIRGEGQGPNDTVITLTATVQDNLFDFIGASWGSWKNEGTPTKITDSIVPSGAKKLSVASTNGLQVGQQVIIRRTPNQSWIDLLEMAQWGWTSSGYASLSPRVIESIQGNTLTLNAPVTNAIETQYGGGDVYPYSFWAALRNVGIENIRLDSTYTSSNDEEHGWLAIRFVKCQDAWIRRVTSRHFGVGCVDVGERCQQITVEDSACIDPVSIVTGGRRYPFTIDDSTYALVQRCYARDARHDFATGSRTAGPNVFVDCLGVASTSDIGPHERYAEGLLFDNIKGGALHVQNRKDSGSGHGWAGAQTVFWNCEGAGIICDAPKAGMNFAIGCKGQKSEGASFWAPEEPFGIWESHNAPVTPRSLYYTQLEERLGTSALLTIIHKEQRNGGIWQELENWRGDSAPPGAPAFQPTQLDLGSSQVTTINTPLQLHALLRNPLPANFPTIVTGWTQVSGPTAVNISDPLVSSPIVRFTTAGTYVLKYRVTQIDNSNLYSPLTYEREDTVSILVLANDDVFDPSLFESIGTIWRNTPSITFNTDSLAVTGGIVANGQLSQNKDGSEIAIFTFASINLNNPPTIIGQRPFVLVSQGDMRINTNLVANGGNGVHAADGVGIVGGKNGGDADRNETPGNPLNGQGRGGSIWSTNASGGGGYGGAGGAASNTGGSTYGDKEMTNLLGGSGAGGNDNKGGGAGGGAIALIATGNLNITSYGSISVNGGAGASSGSQLTSGGGSGGGILLRGDDVSIGGNLSANGGNGGDASGAQVNGGGGGGGRIAIYYDRSIETSGSNILVNPGQPIGVNGTGKAGSLGTIHFGFKPSAGTQWLINYTGKPTAIAQDWMSDYDGDGIVARLEYAFGGSAGKNDAQLQPSMTPDRKHLAFNRRMNGLSANDYVVQTSTSLEESTWTPLSTDETMTIDHPNLTGFQKVYAPIPQNDLKRFVRIVIK